MTEWRVFGLACFLLMGIFVDGAWGGQCSLSISTAEGVFVAKLEDSVVKVSDSFKKSEGDTYGYLYSVSQYHSELQLNAVVSDCEILPLKWDIRAKNQGQNDIVKENFSPDSYSSDSSSSSSDGGLELKPFYLTFSCIKAGLAIVTVKFTAFGIFDCSGQNCSASEKIIEFSFRKSCGDTFPADRKYLCVSTSASGGCNVVCDGVVQNPWAPGWKDPISLDADVYYTSFYVSFTEGNQVASFDVTTPSSALKPHVFGVEKGQNVLDYGPTEVIVIYACNAGATEAGKVILIMELDLRFNNIEISWFKNCGPDKKDLSIETEIGATQYTVVDSGIVEDRWSKSRNKDRVVVDAKMDLTSFVLKARSESVRFSRPAVMSNNPRVCSVVTEGEGKDGADGSKKEVQLNVRYNCFVKGSALISLTIASASSPIVFSWVKHCRGRNAHAPPPDHSFFALVAIGFICVLFLCSVFLLRRRTSALAMRIFFRRRRGDDYQLEEVRTGHERIVNV